VNISRFSSSNERRLTASTFLYFEILFCTSTDDMGAYLKYTEPLDDNSPLISVILNYSPINSGEVEHIAL
jgi:hypothetical protein